MSLTGVQKKDLKAIGKQLREIERTAAENSIDLDVFMTEYSEDGIGLYLTEKISAKAESRKRTFESHEIEKKSSVKH